MTACSRQQRAAGRRPAWALTLVAAVAPVLATLAALFTLAPAAGAQTGSDQIQVLNTVDGADGQVTLEVAIPPSIGKLAPVASNFGVTENGQLRQFDVTALNEPVDVVVVFDTSGSMQGAPLAAAKAAAKSFLDQLPATARVGVVSFSDSAEVRTPVGSGKAAAQQSIASLQAKGETALWDALGMAADAVQKAGSKRPYVVLLTDGRNTVGATTQEQAAGKLGAAGARLYAIALTTPDTDLPSLQAVTGSVGGQVLAAADAGKLQGLYAEVASRLANRYQLRFPTQASVVRQVVVSVAAQSAVATASVTLPANEAAAAGSNPAGPTQVLKGSAPALGTVTVAHPGLLGATWLRWVGLGTMFGAFVILALLMMNPVAKVRLDAAAGVDQVAGLNARLSEATERFLAKRDSEGELDAALDAAAINLRPGEFVLLSVLGVVSLGLLLSFVGGTGLGVFGVITATLLVVLFLRMKMSRQRARFAEQLPDALSIMGGGLKAGRGLPQAIELVAQEAASPLSDQFRRVVFESRVGRDMTTSMLAVAQRMRCSDLEWVTRAIDINRELGGDLTEVLDNVADTIRERRRVARQVRALSAEGRATGWVLLSMPFLLFGFIRWRNPDFAGLLTGTTPGRAMLAVGIFNMVVGFFWVRKLVNIKF